MNTGIAIDSEDFELRRDYQTAIDCLVLCESVIGALQAQLAAKDEEIAALEETAVRMSLELATLKAFEDAHRSTRRVPDGDGGAGAFDPDPNHDQDSRPSSLDGTLRRWPVASGLASVDATVPAMDAGSLISLLSNGSVTVSWDGEDHPVLDDCAPHQTRASSCYVHPNTRRNDDCAIQDKGGGIVADEKNGATRYNRFDYETIWRSCVTLREEIQRSSFYLEQETTGWERDRNAWARMWRV